MNPQEVLEIAKEIFCHRRSQGLKEWKRMESELNFVLNKRKVARKGRKQLLKTVKKEWEQLMYFYPSN